MRLFEILYEDNAIVVVDKAPGVLTVPTARKERNTLVDLLAQRFARGRGTKALHAARPFVVHRLDRETSGLLVFDTINDV